MYVTGISSFLAYELSPREQLYFVFPPNREAFEKNVAECFFLFNRKLEARRRQRSESIQRDFSPEGVWGAAPC